MTDLAPALRSQQLIVTIYGLYGRGHDTALPIAALVQLLGDLGVDAPGVRSSVSRLKRRGVLESRRTNGAASYSISASSRQLFADGDARIYSPHRASVDDPWLLAVFSVPEKDRDKRHALRTELTRLGFGSVTNGVWIAPISVRDLAEHQMQRQGLAQYVTFFSAEYLAEDAAAAIGTWWDLAELDALYQSFIERHEPLLLDWQTRLDTGSTEWAGAGESVGRDAFSDYIPMFTEWRRLPYLDPGLPLAFLPTEWSGARAEQIFRALRQLIGPAADEYVASVTRR